MTCVLGLNLIPVLQAHAGCCFCWKEDGSRCWCTEDGVVEDVYRCQAKCLSDELGYDRYHYIETVGSEGCGCEGPAGTLPYKTDSQGRWRYVVIVWPRVFFDDGVCTEEHAFWT